MTINNEIEKQRALERISEIEGECYTSDAAYEREVLLKMIELYENRQLYEVEGALTPVQAIQFRMQQRGLSQRDLEPFMGSRSKVSEVLSGKRPLTLDMIRALNINLGIPADILLQPHSTEKEDLDTVDWSSFPLREMAKRGWIPDTGNLKAQAKVLMTTLIVKAGGYDALPQGLYRKNDNKRKNAKSDRYALMAWGFRVLGKAREEALSVKYQPGTVTLEFLKQLARFSHFEQGPLLAKEWLGKNGIHLIIEGHLPKTYLDGVAMKLKDGTPLIALTLRYDRIDNFWFTLMHELAHVGRHLSEQDIFFDDHTLRKTDGPLGGDIEAEADDWADQALRPYNQEELGLYPISQDIVRLAHKYQLHPDIIAGQVRYDTGNYRLLPEFRAEVRKYFEEEVRAVS